MDSKKVTKEQREKILEMCKYIYKDYYVSYDANKLYFSERESFVLKIFTFTHIHWFELCSLHLIFDIVYINPNGITDDCRWEELTDLYCTAVFKDAKHPIDFLYEHYLKNKKQLCVD